MSVSLLIAVILVLAMLGYLLGQGRAVRNRSDGAALHSLPSYYGYDVAIWAGVPALILLVMWLLLGDTIVSALVFAGLPDARIEGRSTAELNLLMSEIRNHAFGVGFGTDDPVIQAAASHMASLSRQLSWAVSIGLVAVALGLLAWAQLRIRPQFRARHEVEAVLRWAMIICAGIAVVTTIGIVLSLLVEALRFFARYDPISFLFGLQWSPQTAIREDQVGSSGAFGAVPVFAGTMLIAAIAMLIAAPIGLLSAIYLSEYASRRVRGTIKPILEVLAGIPTIVYGFFAILTVAPFVSRLGASLGLTVAPSSALAAGAVMGVMIIPFVSSLSDDVMNAVPQSLRDGAAGLGATRSETVRQVVLPAALPGIVGALLLAVSRAIGETMIVVMAAGLAANLTINPFEAVTTVTVQIVANLTGDTEFDSAKTLSAFALGLTLFVVTLVLNVIALRVVKKYREKYD